MSELRPRAWTPPPDPGLAGPYAENDRLAGARRMPVPGEGPEDVVGREDGRIAYGLADGRVMTMSPDGAEHRLLADTGGRPLGLEAHPDGRLVVCDARRGLLAVDDAGRVEVLVEAFEGEAFRFTNNAAIADDGTIYFTVSSRRFGIDEYRSDLLEHSNTGRLFRLAPDGGPELLVDGLSFANGVTLAGGRLFVAETGEYRIRVVDPDTGTHGPFAENLPGIPDNLTTGSGDVVWAAMFTPRNRLLDLLLPRPRLRGLVARLPEAVQPQPVRHGFVLGFDASTGEAVENLQDPDGAYAPITSAREHDERLWLGSLTEPAIAVLER